MRSRAREPRTLALVHLALFDEAVLSALHVAKMPVRSPESLAYLLEASGAITPERTGAVLDQARCRSGRLTSTSTPDSTG